MNETTTDPTTAGPRAVRIAVASMMFETNTFAPGVTTMDDFRQVIYVDGPEVLTVGEGLDSIAGAIVVARESGVELVPTTAASAVSGPIVAAGVYPALRARLLEGLAPLRGTVDGVYLQLHGAMACEDEPDAEGDLLVAVAGLMGVPVSASLDLHTHFTDRMATATPLLAGFHTLPHVDMVSTGERAMRLLLARIGGAVPEIAWCQVPMMTSAEGQDTNVEPILGVMRRVAEIIAEPGILDASVFMTQPWLDVPGLGWSTVVVADGDPGLARARSEELARMVWDRRELVRADKVPVGLAIERVCAVVPDRGLGPFVLSDGADSVSAGSPGDGASILAALAAARLGGLAQVIITDAAAAAVCAAAGLGSELTVEVGGSISRAFHEPVSITGTVVTLADGLYRSLYPPRPVDLGAVAVLRVGEYLHVVITAEPACQLDYQLYLRVGLDPRDAHIVVAKSAGGYRAFYEPLARECIDVESVGPSDSRIERLPFARIDRPLYPFDLDLAWEPRSLASSRG